MPKTMQNLLSQSRTELSPNWTVTTVPAATSVPAGRLGNGVTLPELAGGGTGHLHDKSGVGDGLVGL